MESVAQYFVYYPLALCVLLSAIMSVIDVNGMRRWMALIAALAIVVLVAKSVAYPSTGTDMENLWLAGRIAWQGGNPYSISTVLNPPSSVPLFLGLAAFPFAVSREIVAAFNIVGAVTIVLFAHRLLITQNEQDVARMSQSSLVGLAAAVALSIPSHFIFKLGNIAMFMAIFVLLALLAQARNRPALAGVFMALASIKINTMLPMMLLFLNRRDFRTWIWLLCIGLILCLIVPGPAGLIEFTKSNLDNILLLTQEGGINDYSTQGRHFHTILGIDMIVYHIGITDRNIIRVIQLTALGVLGGWILWNVVIRRCWSPGMASSIVALYSVIFFYHRTQDIVLLSLPLVYAAARVQAAEVPAIRMRFLLAMLAILTTMYLHPKLSVVIVGMLAPYKFVAQVAQAVLFPLATWLVLAAMVLMVQGYVLAKANSFDAVNPSNHQ